MDPMLAALFNATITALITQYPGVTFVSTDEVQKMIGKCPEKTILFDSRSEEEYKVSHLRNALRVNAQAEGSDINHYLNELKINESNPIIVYCFSGRRAAVFAKKMADVIKERKEFGLPAPKEALVMSGSIAKWAAEGRPMVDAENWPQPKVYITKKESEKFVPQPLRYLNPTLNPEPTPAMAPNLPIATVPQRPKCKPTTSRINPKQLVVTAKQARDGNVEG